MTFWLIVIAANLVVGAFVGMAGVSGFLLPIVYTGVLSMGVTEGMTLSFAAFILAGALGAFNYSRAGNLNIPFGIRLSLGSLVGAVAGVKLNLIIPEATVRAILSVVVFLSGCSILLSKGNKEENGKSAYVISEHLTATLALGFVTGAVCAMAGAGGPILVTPLLVLLGTDIRIAVGVALFNSVFIGIPACVGYMMQSNLKALLPVMAVSLIIHGVGVIVGSRNAVRINKVLLKKGIAVFSVLIALWMLFR